MLELTATRHAWRRARPLVQPGPVAEEEGCAALSGCVSRPRSPPWPRVVQVGPAFGPARPRHLAPQPVRRWRTDGHRPSTICRTRRFDSASGPDHRTGWRRRLGLGGRAGQPLPVSALVTVQVLHAFGSTCIPNSAPWPHVAPAFPALGVNTDTKVSLPALHLLAPIPAILSVGSLIPPSSPYLFSEALTVCYSVYCSVGHPI